MEYDNRNIENHKKAFPDLPPQDDKGGNWIDMSKKVELSYWVILMIWASGVIIGLWIG